MAKKQRVVEPTDADFEAAAVEMAEVGNTDGEHTDTHGPTQTDTDGEKGSAVVGARALRAVTTMSVEVPLLVESPVFNDCIGRVDLRLPLQSEEVYMLASVRMAAMQRGDKLWNGHLVDSNADVMRWLLQRMVDELRTAQHPNICS